MTPNDRNQSGYGIYNTAIAATSGIQVAFDFNDWGGGSPPADGIVVAIIDGSKSPSLPGAYGGSIGYAQRTGVAGIAGGMLGIALDEFGNFSNPTEGRQGGPGAVAYSVTIRGPGDGTSSGLITTPGGTPNYPNYGYVTKSAALSSTILVPQPSAGSRPTGGNVRHAVVNFDMSDIANGNAYVGVKIYDGNGTLLATPVPNANVGMTLIQYFGAGNVPTTFKLSLTSGTGGSQNTHEVKNLTVDPAAPGGSFGVTDSTVTTGVTPGGSGSSTGDGTYPPGTNITISATAFSGWLFVQWNDGVTNNPRTITVPATNITYTATFAPAATITVTVNNNAGGSATGGGTYLVGNNVVLTATPSNNWFFTGWSDGVTTNPRSIVVTSDMTYTGNFMRLVVLLQQGDGGLAGVWTLGTNYLPLTWNLVTPALGGNWVLRGMNQNRMLLQNGVGGISGLWDTTNNLPYLWWLVSFPLPGWVIRDVDGDRILLQQGEGGTVGIWTLSSSNTPAAWTEVYSPFPGLIARALSGNRVLVQFGDSIPYGNLEIGTWSLDANNHVVSYLQYNDVGFPSGWILRDLTQNYILLQKGDGGIGGLWKLDANGYPIAWYKISDPMEGWILRALEEQQ